jgi:hypothetical protein
VNLDLSVYGIEKKQNISASLPDIHLKNIGGEKNGVLPAEAFEEIFAVLYEKITSPAVTDLLNKQLDSIGVDLDSLGKSAIKGLGDTIEKETGLKDVGDKIKGILGK